LFFFTHSCAANSLGLGTTYKFPCARLSALDYWQETRWGLKEVHRLTWYDTIYDEVLRPRVPRYGIVQEFCSGACEHETRLRTNATYAVQNGYDASYANPLGIFADIGNLEESNQCKICIEEKFDGHMNNMTRDTAAVFQKLGENLQRIADEDGGDSERAAELLEVISEVVPHINRSSIEDFYRYYTTRSLYADLGAETYQTTYNDLMKQYGVLLTSDTFGCPSCSLNQSVTFEQSKAALLRHADNSFSSVNTAGAPLPIWNPITGYLLDPEGIKPGELGPHGGSGIDLSGGPTEGVPLQSGEYFRLGQNLFAENKPLNPFDDVVLYDPVVAWFMAGVLPFTGHCSNEPMPADSKNSALFVALVKSSSPKWCTKHNVPNETKSTKQDFARMWFDLLTNSESFLNITIGESDPYVWTTGEGCGYSLAGQRPQYSNQTKDTILRNASMELYYLDEGVVLGGALDRNILIGGTSPAIGDYNKSNPLKTVRLVQNIYLALVPGDIVEKVKNCNRPLGPINDLTVEEAEAILFRFKKKFEETWSAGWDDPNSGEVQMVGFFDDTGADGSTARMLQEITLSSGTLMVISFIIIILFSVLFLASCDVIQSRVLVTMVGVGLVILSFFAAIGLAILVGIKINVTIGWTLPFIIIGLGVDDMYIISLALKNHGGTSLRDFTSVMREVTLPVTMTSMVNFCMFAVMNLSDIPAAYKTAQAAMLCIAFLWLAVILSFPAYCYLDMKRQDARRVDVFFCFTSKKSKAEAADSSQPSFGAIYEKVYKPLMISGGWVQNTFVIFVWIAAVGLFSAGIYGSIYRNIGLGLEDFFSTESQTGMWAMYRTKYLGSWNIRLNWGALDYGVPLTQLKMMKQFEGVVSSNFVSEIDTEQLWIAAFALWTTRQCSENFVKREASQRECGQDFGCVGTWEKNTLGLRLKNIDSKTCYPRKGGVCRYTQDMHPDDLVDLALQGKYDQYSDEESTWCPVFNAKNNENLQICIERWRDYAGGVGSLLVEPNTATESTTCPGEFYDNDTIVFPIPISSGPLMFGINMQTHDDTISLIQETRSSCDKDDEMHCWMSGIPFDYWEQYLTLDTLLYEVFGISIAVGFCVATAFLFGKITLEHEHSFRDTLLGSVGGALLIILTCVLSTVTVIGMSSLFGVSLTAFSVMSFVLSVGFVVEYSVHIIHRFITAPMKYESARKRVEYSMSFLFLPTFMAFVSSTIGVVCLAFTEFEFNKIYFFRPLMIVMFVTYFFGCFFLPALLSLIELDFLKLGRYSTTPSPSVTEQVSEGVQQSMFRDDVNGVP